MKEQLKALAEQARTAQTAHEKAEICVQVAALSEEETALFLLREINALHREADARKDIVNEALDICCWVNEHKLAKHMMRVELGGSILKGTLRFLKELLLWHHDKVERSQTRYEAELHKWVKNRRDEMKKELQ